MGNRSRNNTINLCYICNRKRPCEREHVWPDRLGGKSTAPICVSCHDALDRMNIDSLPMAELSAGWAELTDEFGIEWQRTLWGLFEHPPEDKTEALKPYLDVLASFWGFKPPGRLVGLKMVRVLMERCGLDAEPPAVAEFCEVAKTREEGDAYPMHNLPGVELSETDP